MANKPAHRLGEIIAHWNLEHTPEERQAHLDWANAFLKESGLDKFMTARMRKPSELWVLGWPKTVLDLKLRRKYCNRTYRHRGSGARIINLSVFHITFTRCAGVYDFDRAQNEVHQMTRKCKGPKDAARISAWTGWDGTVCDYTLRTDARHIGYGCRHASGYDGDSGDSFKYGPDFTDIHKRLGDVLYRIVDDLQLRSLKKRK